MREIDRVHLEATIHPVRLGAKPASSMTIAAGDLAEVLDIVRHRGLQHSASKVLKHDAYEVHIFQKPHLKNVVENAPVFDDPVVEAWYWGKLYGYSEEAIASYANKHCPATLRAGRQGVGVVVKDNQLPVLHTFVGPFARLLARSRHITHPLSTAVKAIVIRGCDRR